MEPTLPTAWLVGGRVGGAGEKGEDSTSSGVLQVVNTLGVGEKDVSHSEKDFHCL